MKTLALLLLIAGATLFISCSKERPNATPADNNLINARSVQVSPDNPDNPYDFFGKEHNRLLGKIKQYLEQGGENTITGRSKFLLSITSTHANAAELDQAVYYIINDTASRYLNNLQKLSVRQEVKVAVKAIYQEVIDIKRNDNYQHFKTRMLQTEARVLKDYSFTDNEKRLLLCVSSVARHSTYYWLHDTGLTITAGGHTTAAGFLKNLVRIVGAVMTDISATVEGIIVENDLPAAIAEAADASSYTYDALAYIPDF